MSAQNRDRHRSLSPYCTHSYHLTSIDTNIYTHKNAKLLKIFYIHKKLSLKCYGVSGRTVHSLFFQHGSTFYILFFHLLAQ